MKMAFEECNDIIEETIKETTKQTLITTKETQNQTLWIIVSIIVITIVLIAVIVSVIYVLRRMKVTPNTRSKSAITQSTEKSFPQYPKGSITDDIDRYHNRFIQSKNESTSTTKTSVKSRAKSKSNNAIKSVVSPSK